MAQAWERLAADYHSSGKRVIIAKVDCSLFKPLCNTHNIRGYPTLVWFFNGEMVRLLSLTYIIYKVFKIIHCYYDFPM